MNNASTTPETLSLPATWTGRGDRMTWIDGIGWVIHPADYDLTIITEADCQHDCALRVVCDLDAEAIMDGELTA
jgi:hypothetical protein